ncbi:MAG TPA: tricarballylate utilization 4Fe-4S protein TcuB [Acidocella sp.]|uniref:tricarballylate utilization 4Fe-4S protein TcuB n=1 Tax=Acidocella sp. TaxID=50710 RepID=UPI002BFF1263|nr:tricarballylate utilization 4Fe-4S protein TcuB [Acidocella sp.]HVE23030.1 tricarballylate utilization 4Fe-4S protein TcuB [Acidocella sp.]
MMPESPAPQAPESQATQDARRAMEVCNACRYCEGFCAVFPAMELHRDFAKADLSYLANLCHGCKGCYYACQYAPPHEFGINVAKSLAELRQESYGHYAWPQALSGAFERNGLITALAMSGGIAAVLLLTLLLQQSANMFGVLPMTPGAGFYLIIPKAVMTLTALAAFAFALLALAVGFRNFWKESGPAKVSFGDIHQALKDAASLRYLGGAGHGCNDKDGAFSNQRRYLHHLMAYGFLFCFAATSVGAVYDLLLGWPAPYPLASLPVLLGMIGGAGIIVGCAGLLWLKMAADRDPQAPSLLGADTGLLLLLLLIAITGLLLLGLRSTSALGVALCIHLGLVLSFFLTMPYSKFVHGLYRFGALIRYAANQRPHQ